MAPPLGGVAEGGPSPIIEAMTPSAESPQPTALPEELGPDLEIAQLTAALEALRDDRQRAECMAAIQRDAVQLTLDLLVTHPDLPGFLRACIKRLGDDSEAPP